MGDPHASTSAKPDSDAQLESGQQHITSTINLPAKRSLKRRRASDSATAASALSNASTLPPGLPDDVRRQVETRRGVLLRARTGSLKEIMNDHDSQVREAFHLEKFVTLVGYDPKVAKEDSSNVYQEFKSHYDLMNAIPTGHVLHSRKQTRGQLNQNAELLATLSSLADSDEHTELKKTGANFTNGKPRRYGVPRSREPLSSGPCYVTTHEFTAPNGRQYSNETDHLSLPRGRTGRPRKGSYSGATVPPSSIEMMSNRAEEARLTRPLELPSSFAKVKRIKVIHRLAPPEYTDPDQRPPPVTFGKSVSAYLDSYTALDEDHIPFEELSSLARSDALVRQRVADLRIQGRMRDGILPRPLNATVSAAPPKLVHWDTVISHVGIASRRVQEEGRNKLNMSRRVSRAVLAHFEKAANAEDRERQAEEKRLRALAKFTVKEVIKKWREAIQHVRDLKLAHEKAEQAKIGKEQLNAILEQSTQVLEAQHLDLSRNVAISRSRSNSTPASWPDSHSETNESDDYTTEVEQEQEEGDEGEEGEGEEQEEEEQEEHEQNDKDFILADEVFAGPVGQALSSPSSFAQGDEMGKDPDVEWLSHGSPEYSEHPGTRSEPSDEWMSPPHSVILDPGLGAALDVPRAPGPEPPNNAGMSRNALSKVLNVSPVVNTASRGLPEPQDPDFIDEAETIWENEDRLFEQDMELEDEAGDEDSDEELGGLEDDANLPIENILRKYGYQASAAEDADDVDATSPSSLTDGSDLDAFDQFGHSTLTSPGPQSPGAQLEADSPGQRSTGSGQVLPEDGHLRQPFLLRGVLRPYQHAGLEWLVSLYNNGLNGILADEMGLGKTIQTIALLAHLACERGIWGPHLIIVPTSVILNWEMEFKRFLPGFKILTYYGNVKERREKRTGWNTENTFNVCITSYQLVLADQHIFRRKKWCYMILDEAHNIKNFRSQRWQTLLGFHSSRRLLLTGTPLQNNLMELWSLLYFLMPSGLSEQFSGGTFAGQKEFQEWFSNPMDKAIQNKEGPSLDEDTLDTVNKLHTLLRPYLLRRMKAEVEKQLPAKYEHLVECRLSKRQRLLYDEFMQRASTRETLAVGNFLSVVNLLMQLRKICNHPDLFEVRPIMTSFAMARSATAEFEIKELLLRRSLLAQDPLNDSNLEDSGLVFTHFENLSSQISRDTMLLDASGHFPFISELPGEPPPLDTVTIEGFKKRAVWHGQAAMITKWQHLAYINSLRCSMQPVYGSELLRCVRKMHYQVVPLEEAELDKRHSLRKLDRVHAAVLSYRQRAELLSGHIDRFAVITPAAVCLDLPRLALPGINQETNVELVDPAFDTLHNVAVKLQIAFPDASLLQFDCGKLQELDVLLRELKRGAHRVLIFTQMTRVLDILEIFLNFHGYRYLRLDGATKIEQRQIVTERFNVDKRVFAFIASSRSGGVGINLTGADAVIFYDSDFNPAMDRQCEDRAHRIGQTRDVHIYRFVTKHTIEENMLLTANQKRKLDDVVIRQGDFDWRKFLVDDLQMEQALAQVEDQDDAAAAQIARAEGNLDATDFEEPAFNKEASPYLAEARLEEEESEVGGTTVDYMVLFVEHDWEYFSQL